MHVRNSDIPTSVSISTKLDVDEFDSITTAASTWYSSSPSACNMKAFAKQVDEQSI